MSPAKRRGVNLDGLRVATLAVAVFVLSVVVVVRFGDQLEKVNWALVALVAMLIGAGYLSYRWNASQNGYDVVDLFVNHETGRADLWKHFAIAGFGVSVWAIVQSVLAKQPVTELLLGLFGILVGKVALDGVSKAIERRP